MDLEHAKIICETLYADIDGYGVSNIGRNTHNYRSRSFTYGEITPEAFYHLLKEADPKPGDVFYDLGSGTGKAVILAALTFPLSRAVGIEIVDSLYDASISVLERYRSEVLRSQLLHNPPEVSFVMGNFLEHDLSNVDIIFAHSTCFDENLMSGLERKLDEVKKGARVITVTKDLSSPSFRIVKRREYNMNWGTSTVHTHIRI